MAASVLRTLSEGDLAALLPAPLLTAAEDYLVAGRLRQPLAAGPRLATRLEGFRADYDVTASFAGEQPILTCTCGKRQPCRHSAALVLAWVRRRPWFIDLDELLRPLAAAPGQDLVRLLGRLAAEPDDRLTPLLEAAGRFARDPEQAPTAAPGAWLGPTEVAETVSRLADGWDTAARRLRTGTTDEATAAWQALLRMVEDLAGLLRRAQDEDGLLPRFLGACLAQVGAWAADPALGDEGRQQAFDRLARLLVAGPAEAFQPAAAALAALGAADAHRPVANVARGDADAARDAAGAGLADRGTAVLLAEAWGLEARRQRNVDPAAVPALALREGAVLEALSGLLEATGRDADLPVLLAPFRHIWQAALRRVEVLRRLGRLEEALLAAREGLAEAEGQSALDLHQVSGELLVALNRPAEAVPHLRARYLGRPEAPALEDLRRAAEAAGVWEEVKVRLATRPL